MQHTARRLVPMCLGLLTALALAGAAPAQTYVWTDERGVVHAAAEPGEVPEKYRAKAVQDAQRARSKFTVLPPAEPAAPESSDDPTAPAPMKPGHRPQHAAPPAEPVAPPPPAETRTDDGDEPRKKSGRGDPEPGFEWHCSPDPDGGKPRCEQFEKRSSKRARHAAAREEARKQMGVERESELDPEVREELQRRADKEYERTTKKPTAPDPPRDDEDETREDEPED